MILVLHWVRKFHIKNKVIAVINRLEKEVKKEILDCDKGGK